MLLNIGLNLFYESYLITTIGLKSSERGLLGQSLLRGHNLARTFYRNVLLIFNSIGC
jgi:hypothetical protein